jgi:hypothetical protein
MSRRDELALTVPPHSVRWFEKGEHCADAVDGDLLLVRHHTLLADAISAGQEALLLTQPDLEGFTWNDHCAIIRGHDSSLRTMVSEMGPRGYERRPLFDYQAELYAVVHFDVSTMQRETACLFDAACASVDYGWLEYLDLIVDGVTNAKFAGSWGDAIICSTHCALVLMGLGLFPDREPSNVIPAHFSLWTGARRPAIA